MKAPEKPKRLCADCDHYEVCQAHSHTGVLHELNANRCGLYSDRTHDRKRIAVLEQVVEEGNMQIQQLEAANAELLTKVEQLEAKCLQLERERDAAVADLKAMADKIRDVYGNEIPCFCCKHDKDIHVTESGAWSAECPGFSADDCFEWRGVKEE